MEKEVKIGDIVLSKAGRDAGKYFVVVKAEGNFCYICNGKLRGCSKPKKKKLRHIERLGRVSDFAADKLCSGENLTDREFKAEIRSFEENISN